MDDLDRYLKDALQDPEFRAEYEALEPVYAVKKQLIQARLEQNLTQAELARRIGISRSALARLESGNFNPTLKNLQRIAHGLGKTLTLTFR
ncbi:MAG: helix-turn-helix transcriptional regulator [Planctomycetia bacterium]|nr:helix-turn-helix transcriptional regulator [Planctomycetia bacterium]